MESTSLPLFVSMLDAQTWALGIPLPKRHVLFTVREFNKSKIDWGGSCIGAHRHCIS